MGKETAALLLIALVHLVGAAVLLWAMAGGERLDARGWWPRDDRPEPPAPEPPPPSGGGLPLPDAVPAARRLRTAHDRATARRRDRRPRTPNVPHTTPSGGVRDVRPGR